MTNLVLPSCKAAESVTTGIQYILSRDSAQPARSCEDISDGHGKPLSRTGRFLFSMIASRLIYSANH